MTFLFAGSSRHANRDGMFLYSSNIKDFSPIIYLQRTIDITVLTGIPVYFISLTLSNMKYKYARIW